MPIIHYNPKLKALAAHLRSQGTKSEIILWNQLKGSQVNGFRFIRQKPIGDYIVDFYIPSAKIVIEIDGSQHYEKENRKDDKERDFKLNSEGIKVLRYSNLDVNRNFEGVCHDILNNINTSSVTS